MKCHCSKVSGSINNPLTEHKNAAVIWHMSECSSHITAADGTAADALQISQIWGCVTTNSARKSPHTHTSLPEQFHDSATLESRLTMSKTASEKIWMSPRISTKIDKNLSCIFWGLHDKPWRWSRSHLSPSQTRGPGTWRVTEWTQGSNRLEIYLHHSSPSLLILKACPPKDNHAPDLLTMHHQIPSNPTQS